MFLIHLFVLKSLFTLIPNICLLQELKEEEDYKYLVEDYILTFSQIIKFENTAPDTDTLREIFYLLLMVKKLQTRNIRL